ncbi:MAG: 5'-methylthioadenosine/adenosylhomocysteine nucleosidase [Bacteroidales bacterium]|nr:5'-methylthioadenosine/adenosylhomocysteine nucleosidase [Bacteroidales bacterium]
MIGIMGAMQEEIAHLVEALTEHKQETSGMRTYHTGTLYGQPVVIVFSRWGKVAAAATATHLLLHYRVSELIFTGVAGAVDHDLRMGDVVVGNRLFQHDMDARPLMKKYEIPLLKRKFFETNAPLSDLAFKATREFLSDISVEVKPEKATLFGLKEPRVIRGNIASGDRFIAKNSDISEMMSLLPDLACVEMEGAAVAQVCFEHDVPFTVIRTISDVVGIHSETDVMEFIHAVASNYSNGIIRNLFRYKNEE